MSTEEKLQEAAKEFADKNTQGCIPIIAQEKYNGFIIGAKSPESLEYWKEKEKLWTNQEVYNLFTEYFADNGRGEYEREPFNQWFELNKKK